MEMQTVASCLPLASHHPFVPLASGHPHPCSPLPAQHMPKIYNLNKQMKSYWTLCYWKLRLGTIWKLNSTYLIGHCAGTLQPEPSGSVGTEGRLRPIPSIHLGTGLLCRRKSRPALDTGSQALAMSDHHLYWRSPREGTGHILVSPACGHHI